jgi:hypothetical protein
LVLELLSSLIVRVRELRLSPQHQHPRQGHIRRHTMLLKTTAAIRSTPASAVAHCSAMKTATTSRHKSSSLLTSHGEPPLPLKIRVQRSSTRPRPRQLPISVATIPHRTLPITLESSLLSLATRHSPRRPLGRGAREPRRQATERMRTREANRTSYPHKEKTKSFRRLKACLGLSGSKTSPQNWPRQPNRHLNAKGVFGRAPAPQK